MSQIVVTTITRFILVSLFLPQAGIRAEKKHGMLNLVRDGPRLLKLVRIGPRMLKLVRAGPCLLNLVHASRLVVGGYRSGAALVRDGRGRGRYRRGCAGSLIHCGRVAGQEWSFPFLCRVECCTLPSLNTMLLSQVHLLVSWLARKKLSMAAWAMMATDIIAAEKGGKPLSFIRWQGHAFARPFYAFWFFVSQPRVIRKKAE